jgi:hypothetical protein
MSMQEDLIAFDDHLEPPDLFSDRATCSSSEDGQSCCSVGDFVSEDLISFHDMLEFPRSLSIQHILSWQEHESRYLPERSGASNSIRSRSRSCSCSIGCVTKNQASGVYHGHAPSQTIEPGSNISSTRPGMCTIVNSNLRKASSRRTKRSAVSRQKTSQRAPSTHSSARPNIDDQLFARMLRGDQSKADTHRLVLQGEISYSFTPTMVHGQDANEGGDVVGGDEEIMRNMANLVKGRHGVYPKGRVKGWGVCEIQRATGADGEMGEMGTGTGL